MKRILILLGSVLLLLILLNARGIYLKTIVFFSESKVVSQYECGSGYFWKVIETQSFDKGNKFALGHYSRILHKRQLGLYSSDRLIKEDFSSPAIMYADLLKAFELTGEKNKSNPTYRGVYLHYKISDLPQQAFDLVSSCLMKSVAVITREINVVSVSHGIESVPGVLQRDLHIFGTVLRSNENTAERVFNCEASTTLTVEGENLLRNAGKSDARYVARITTQGTLTQDESNSFNIEQLKNIDLSACYNGSTSLKDWLAEIPRKVRTLP